jgi:hypothetical protein
MLRTFKKESYSIVGASELQSLLSEIITPSESSVHREMLQNIIDKQPVIGKMNSTEKKKLTSICGYYFVQLFEESVKEKTQEQRDEKLIKCQMLMKYLIDVQNKFEFNHLVKILFAVRMHPYYIKQIILNSNIKQNFISKLFYKADPLASYYNMILEYKMPHCFVYDRDIKSGKYSALAKEIQKQCEESVIINRKTERRNFEKIFIDSFGNIGEYDYFACSEHYSSCLSMGEFKDKSEKNLLELPRRSDFLPRDMYRIIIGIFKLYGKTEGFNKQSIGSFIKGFVGLDVKKVETILNHLNSNQGESEMREQFLDVFFAFKCDNKKQEVINQIYKEVKSTQCSNEKNCKI